MVGFVIIVGSGLSIAIGTWLCVSKRECRFWGVLPVFGGWVLLIAYAQHCRSFVPMDMGAAERLAQQIVEARHGMRR